MSPSCTEAFVSRRPPAGSAGLETVAAVALEEARRHRTVETRAKPWTWTVPNPRPKSFGSAPELRAHPGARPIETGMRSGQRKREMDDDQMMTTDSFDQLIEHTRDLDARAKAIQGERELLVDQHHVDQLVHDYQDWFARAVAILPPEFIEKFQDLYEGGFVVKRIKAFLEGPGRVNAFFDPEQASGLIPYWEHPYETTFHSSLLEQRQILTLAKQFSAEQISAAELELVLQIGRGFPALVHALRNRHDGRTGITTTDEYDVQDLIGGVLRMIFEDVRPEDPSPTRAGASSRIDFVLKGQRIVVETKMTREGRGDRQIGDELIQDVERYRGHPDCSALVAIVYDPGHHIRNPRGLEGDLSGDRDGLLVRVLVVTG